MLRIFLSSIHQCFDLSSESNCIWNEWYVKCVEGKAHPSSPSPSAASVWDHGWTSCSGADSWQMWCFTRANDRIVLEVLSLVTARSFQCCAVVGALSERFCIYFWREKKENNHARFMLRLASCAEVRNRPPLWALLSGCCLCTWSCGHALQKCHLSRNKLPEKFLQKGSVLCIQSRNAPNATSRRNTNTQINAWMHILVQNKPNETLEMQSGFRKPSSAFF